MFPEKEWWYFLLNSRCHRVMSTDFSFFFENVKSCVSSWVLINFVSSVLALYWVLQVTPQHHLRGSLLQDVMLTNVKDRMSFLVWYEHAGRRPRHAGQGIVLISQFDWPIIYFFCVKWVFQKIENASSEGECITEIEWSTGVQELKSFECKTGMKILSKFK